jgi:presqualene diphosphate synthase
MTLEAAASPDHGTTASGSSFYAAMRILPAEQRQAMFQIYSFCRHVDDIADSDGPRDERLAALQVWRDDIDALYRGQPPARLADYVTSVKRFELQRADFLAIVDGMEMDVPQDIRAPDLATLDLYCDRVASAVGRLSVRVFGLPQDDGILLAHHLGRALQLTNILRDIAEDAARGRLYLPRELLAAHGIADSDPATVLRHPGLRVACRDLARIAARHYDDADAAFAQCGRRAMRPAAIMKAIYRATFDRLVAADWRDLDRPVRIPTPLKLWLALRHGIF